MKSFLLSSLTLIMAAAVVTPSALASGAVDLNNNGVLSMQERRIHYLDHSTK